MDNRELEDIAKKLAASMTASALTIRGSSDSVAACVGGIDCDGEVDFLLVPPHVMDERFEMIADFVEASKSVAFVFVYDGYQTTFDKRPCPFCGGAGTTTCGLCRGIGKAPSGRTKAVVAIIRTAWGASFFVSTPYQMEGGVARIARGHAMTDSLELASSPDYILDGYDAIFGKRAVVH